MESCNTREKIRGLIGKGGGGGGESKKCWKSCSFLCVATFAVEAMVEWLWKKA